MKVHVNDDSTVHLEFHSTEIRFALGVLKALYTHTRLDFIGKAIDDIEKRLTHKMPQLTHILTHRICETCFCEIDLKRDQHIVRDDVYRHTQCPALYPASYRER